MKIFLSLFISLSLLVVALTSRAEVIGPPPLMPPVQPVDHSHDYLVLQIIQDQFVLDHSTIRHASLLIRNDGSYAGLQIELKPQAVSSLERMTQTAVGKNINLMLEKRVIAMPIIQTPLVGKFIIASISKEEAQSFLRALNFNKGKPPIVRG